MNEWMYGKVKQFSSHCLPEGKLHYIADDALMAYRTAHNFDQRESLGSIMEFVLF